MTPAEIPLTLSADVLRLPYTAAQRLVLAEIVSLYSATGCCDASNPHFMARLTLKRDVVNEAIQLFDDEGLVVKVVNKSAGFYRTLTPVPAAIAAKAAMNPYPEKPTSQSENPTTPPSRKSRLGQSENPTTPSRENPLTLVGNPDTNTPFNIPSNFHQYSTPSADASEPANGKKIEEEILPAALPAQALASHTEGAAADVATSIPKSKPAKVAPEEAPAFLAFWQAYPRHEHKVKAAQSFARLKPEEQALATELAPAFFARRPATDWFGKEGQDYRPHAASWLNGKRWKEATEPHPTPVPTASSQVSQRQANSAGLRARYAAKTP